MSEAVMASPHREVLATWFRISGVPAPKGSKTAFPIHRKDGSVGVAVVEGKGQRFAEWNVRVLERVQYVVSRSKGFELPIQGPLVVELDFFLPKPKSAPKRRRVWPERKPDIDKLVRGCLDPMSGSLIRDDAQVVELRARKFYAEDVGEMPGAEVRIRTINEVAA